MVAEELQLFGGETEITLPTLTDQFCATKQTEGRSSRTIEWYRESPARFADFLKNGERRRLQMSDWRVQEPSSLGCWRPHISEVLAFR